jgi:SAM-dependent methyltransferase
MSIHPGPTLRKIAFTLTGRPRLMDPVRDFVYRWARDHLRGIPRKARILDIGCRNSSFAAFLAWRGYRIVAVDPDERAASWQEHIRRAWGVEYRFVRGGIEKATTHGPYDAVLTLFALQHAGEADTEEHRRAAGLVGRGGLLLSACEYDHRGTRWHRGRADGDMRVYGPADLATRLIEPLESAGLEITGRRYATGNPRPRWCDETGASMCLVAARRSAPARVDTTERRSSQRRN